jgi:acetyltransferase-like isoleucine patch superfamily enzyme
MLKLLLSSTPFRHFTWLVVASFRAFGRLASYARARMLFPNSDVVIHWSAEVKYPENITLGKRVVIGPRCTIGAVAPIHFGDDAHLSKGVFVETGTLDIDTTLPPYRSSAKPIHIGRGVWLGAASIVLAGVTIGENSVVSAGAVIRKSIPPNTLVANQRPLSQSLDMLSREPMQ